jgi:hypothetical protein
VVLLNECAVAADGACRGCRGPLGDLVGAPPEAEVNPVPPSSAGEGSLAAPVPTVAGEAPLLAPAPTTEDPPKVVAEPAAEDPMAAAGPSQVAE